MAMPLSNRLPIALGLGAVLLVSGCGGDEEEIASAPVTTAPTVAPAPAPTTTQPVAPTTATTPAKKQAAPEPEPEPPSAEPHACETGKAISRLKFQGVACDQAATVADAWDQDQDRCNTIDDPNSPEGYNRTCTVEDYTCRAKRDVKSDARFVACAKGSAQVRFTWAPP